MSIKMNNNMLFRKGRSNSVGNTKVVFSSFYYDHSGFYELKVSYFLGISQPAISKQVKIGRIIPDKTFKLLSY